MKSRWWNASVRKSIGPGHDTVLNGAVFSLGAFDVSVWCFLCLFSSLTSSGGKEGQLWCRKVKQNSAVVGFQLVALRRWVCFWGVVLPPVCCSFLLLLGLIRRRAGVWRQSLP